LPAKALGIRTLMNTESKSISCETLEEEDIFRYI
jgi:hypothetical protein